MTKERDEMKEKMAAMQKINDDQLVEINLLKRRGITEDKNLETIDERMDLLDKCMRDYTLQTKELKKLFKEN